MVTSLGLCEFLLLTELSSVRVWGVSHAAGCWYLSQRAGCFGSSCGCPKAEYPKCAAALRLLYELTTKNQLWRVRTDWKQNIFPIFSLAGLIKLPCSDGLQFRKDLCEGREPARGALGRSLELLECISPSQLSVCKTNSSDRCLNSQALQREFISLQEYTG